MKAAAFLVFLFATSLSALGQGELVVRAEQGDTVKTLAARYSVEPSDIAVLNGISEGNTLAAGQQIKLPFASRAARPIERPAEVLSDANLPASCTFVEDVGADAPFAYKLYFQQETLRRRGERVEIWTCIEPVNPVSYRSEYKLPPSFSFALQHVTIECDLARISARRIIPYEQSGRPITAAPQYGMELFGEPIIPGSAGGRWKARLCG